MDSGRDLPGAERGNVVLGDADGDGDLDAFVGSGPARIWLNDGGGEFTVSGQIPDGDGWAGWGRITVGDLDGDGKIDRYGAVSGARRDEAMWDFTHYFHGFGGQFMDEETWEVTVNNERGLAALTFYADLLNKHKVVSPDSG